MKLYSALLICLLVVPASVRGQRGAPQSASIVIRASTILDGKGGVVKNRNIVVDGSRISKVEAGAQTATYDLTGLTVVPGFIDTHVHINWHFDSDGKTH